MGSDQLFILDVSGGPVAGLLVDAGKRSLTPVASSYREPGPEEDIIEAAEEVIQRCGASECRCHLALPPSLFHFKNVNLPFSDRRKIDETLPYELLDLVSFGDEPLLYDTILVESTPTTTRLLATVAKKAALSPWLDLLTNHGLSIEILTVSPLARLSQLGGSTGGSSTTYDYLDICPRESFFFQVSNGLVAAIRPLPGMGADGSAGLRDELVRTVRALQANGRMGSATPLWVGGSGAEKIGDDWLEEVAEFSRVEIIDSTELGLSDTQATQMLPVSLGPRLWGLAKLQDDDQTVFNLVRKKAPQTAGLGPLKKFAPALLLLLAAVALVAGYQVYDYQKMASNRDRLAQQSEQIFSQTMGGRKPVTDPVAELKARINEIDQSVVASLVEHPEISSVAILSDISKRMPAAVRVSFERFSFDRRKVRIDGVTGAYNDVDIIKKSLERSPLFSAVAIDSAGTSGDGTGVKFSLTLVL